MVKMKQIKSKNIYLYECEIKVKKSLFSKYPHSFNKIKYLYRDFECLLEKELILPRNNSNIKLKFGQVRKEKKSYILNYRIVSVGKIIDQLFLDIFINFINKQFEIFLEKQLKKLKKTILLFDMDDVIVKFIDKVLEEFNKKYNTSYILTDINTWSLASILGQEVNEIMRNGELFKNLEPKRDALKTIEYFYNHPSFEVYLVTAAIPTTVDGKYEWIKKYMPYFPLKNIIVTESKHMVRGDVLLDDGGHNIIAFGETDREAVIYDMPHNQHITDSKYKRIKTWNEYKDYILKKYIN